jgi:predicted alpha/beta hydrolase family esterase
MHEKEGILKAKVLILPGIGNSGPEHWQSLWEKSNPSFRRVEQTDWDAPVCSEWIASVENAVSNSGPETVLVAHSLACLLVAHWAAVTSLRIRSALLVAVPDPEGANFPAEAIGFGPVPQKVLPFRTIVAGGALPAVASTNDPYGSVDHARRCASVWGSDLVVIEGAGHINSASGLGEWREGFALLQRLVA